MILRSAGPSPFGRKVKIVAKLTGLYDSMTVKDTDTIDPQDSIRQQNPLGKIPTLVLDDGTSLYDSRVICEYLNSHSKAANLYPDGEERWTALRQQALADGIMDAGILQVYEKRYRPENMYHEPWLELQRGKVERAVAAVESEPPALDRPMTIGHVAIACALGYLDFRFDGTWRKANPKLVAWLDAFAKEVPAFDATRPAA